MSNPDYLDLEADFGDVIGILREGRVDPPTERPSLDVWNAIAQGLDDEGVVPEAQPLLAEEPERSNVVSLDGRRSLGKQMAVLTGIAAAFLLVAVPLALALRSESGQRAELAALGEFDGVGEAELAGRTLTLNLEGLDPLDDGSTYDVWLLDPAGEDPMAPLWIGFAEPDGTFTVPEDADLNEFTVVDVSIEPDDGDATHSGNSVLRGPLQEA